MVKEIVSPSNECPLPSYDTGVWRTWQKGHSTESNTKGCSLRREEFQLLLSLHTDSSNLLQ